MAGATIGLFLVSLFCYCFLFAFHCYLLQFFFFFFNILASLSCAKKTRSYLCLQEHTHTHQWVKGDTVGIQIQHLDLKGTQTPRGTELLGEPLLPSWSAEALRILAFFYIREAVLLGGIPENKKMFFKELQENTRLSNKNKSPRVNTSPIPAQQHQLQRHRYRPEDTLPPTATKQR